MTPPSSSGALLFSSLPKWRAPWSEFLFSYSVQATIIAVFFWVPILAPQVLESKKDYHAIELVPTPVPENHEPQRQLRKPLLARLEPVDAPAALRLPVPQPQPRAKLADAPAPEIKIAAKKLDAVPTPVAPVIPRQIVRTNLFSTGSSAPQTIERAPQHVQTGGFGDPNGVPARTTQTRAVNIAQAGGFDLPTGPGYGNGTGGANGVRGVVASTGFGGGVATGNAKLASPTGVVRNAGFGNADVPAPPTVQSHPAESAVAKLTPAEILSKPLPVYTDEARAKKIEGEVLLEVVFEASGKLHVVKVVRGLGHGLDDAAIRAAEQIRFKPALRDGQPADSTAVVHIIFQIA
ncbi:MAG TPA: energy transducer TonB [Candidatus Sulfotelmatobacter sp.]|nr:energy transducer TonB [Candidatus Sulfotelmatobacter sp.]